MWVTKSARALDTDPKVDAMIVAHWRSSSVAQRAEMVRRLCRDVDLLARAQIRSEQTELDDLGVAQELARRRYGRRLAEAAYAGRLPQV